MADIDVTELFKRSKVVMDGAVPDITMKWPNALGESAGDALGKDAFVALDGVTRRLTVAGYSGDTLHLSPAKHWGDA